MSVYVDNVRIRFGRMVMSHMFADSTDELLAMVDKIGVARRWIQKAGTPREHFDISAGKRDLAIQNGAIAMEGSEIMRTVIWPREGRTPAGVVNA